MLLLLIFSFLMSIFNQQTSKRPRPSTTKYLFAYFRGEYETNGEQVYFATSEDGLHWEELNGKGKNQKPVLTSTVGEKGVRDMFIIRSPENNKFFLIASDLKINGNWDWDRAQHKGSHSIVIWDSKDLVHWSEPRNVTVAASNAGCTWAPESIFIDAKENKAKKNHPHFTNNQYFDDDYTGYAVYWASRVFENGQWSQQKIYMAKTQDFVTFSPPQLFINESYDVIDTTIIKSTLDNNYYRFSKNESKKNIVIQKTDDFFSTWKTISAPAVESQNGVEAPLIFKFNNENRWCLMLDNYGSSGYYPLITNNLSGEELVFEKLDQSEYQMPGNPRHGYVLPITDYEYRDVRNRWYVE